MCLNVFLMEVLHIFFLSHWQCPNGTPTISQKFYMLSPNGVIWKESQWKMPSSSFMKCRISYAIYPKRFFFTKSRQHIPVIFALNVDLYLNSTHLHSILNSMGSHAVFRYGIRTTEYFINLLWETVVVAHVLIRESKHTGLE